MLTPFNLDLGSSIYAKVTATNFYGSSQVSDVFNGAYMVILPDAPTNLADNEAVTTASVIGLTWNEGLSDGGTPILDYAISYDQSNNRWIDLAIGVTTRFY